jgi:MFS family permease
MGKIRSAPRDAIVADVSDDNNRGKNFGILRTMDNLGAVCGILFCIAFFNLGYKTLFLIAAVPSLIGAGLILFSIKEIKDSSIKIFRGLSLRDLSRDFWIFLILSSVFSLGAFSYSFLLLYSKAAGIQQSSIPVLYLVFTSCAAAASYYFGKLSDRVGRKIILLTSFILWIGVTAGFIFIRTYTGIVVLLVLYGLHKAALEPVQKTFVAELAPVAYRSSSLGAFQMVIGIFCGRA